MHTQALPVPLAFAHSDDATTVLCRALTTDSHPDTVVEAENFVPTEADAFHAPDPETELYRAHLSHIATLAPQWFRAVNLLVRSGEGLSEAAAFVDACFADSWRP